MNDLSDNISTVCLNVQNDELCDEDSFASIKSHINKTINKIAHNAKSVDCSKKLDAKLADRRTKQDESFHVTKKHGMIHLVSFDDQLIWHPTSANNQLI